ncbi:MAG: hypothetical protein JXA24_05565 [Proteobacteria bacterium]|nr:hypothetical protein [Pseudomonadota bacterium]
MFMKKTLCFAAFAAAILVSASAHAFTTGGFTNPYGVAVDARTNFIFVSNVNGSLDAKDDNGFISRLKGDGSLDNLRFIDGASRSVELHAPKGMAVVGTTLYVCDIDKLRAYDTTFGNHLFDVNFGNLPVQHFYDVKAGPDNSIYVADGPGNRIYRIDLSRQHEVTTLVFGESLGRPHAVVWYSAKQVFAVAGWSSGQVTAYNRQGKQRPLPAVFLRTLEGMDADEKGNLYVASTGLSGVYRIDIGFALNSFNTGIDSPAGVAFDKAGGQIIAASFNGGTVESMPVVAEAIVRPAQDTFIPAPAPSVPAAPPVPVPAPPEQPAPPAPSPEAPPEQPAPQPQAETPPQEGVPSKPAQ